MPAARAPMASRSTPSSALNTAWTAARSAAGCGGEALGIDDRARPGAVAGGGRGRPQMRRNRRHVEARLGRSGGHPVHAPVVGRVVEHRVVLGREIVPDHQRIRLPAEAHQELRLLDPFEEHGEQRIADIEMDAEELLGPDRIDEQGQPPGDRMVDDRGVGHDRVLLDQPELVLVGHRIHHRLAADPAFLDPAVEIDPALVVRQVVIRLEAEQHGLDLVGQRIERRGGRRPDGVAAGRRQLHRAQQVDAARPGAERHVGVPAVGFRLVVALVGDGLDLGIALDVREELVLLQFAELAAQADIGLRLDRLVAEEQDVVLPQRRLDLFVDGVAPHGVEIDVRDHGADIRRHRLDRNVGIAHGGALPKALGSGDSSVECRSSRSPSQVAAGPDRRDRNCRESRTFRRLGRRVVKPGRGQSGHRGAGAFPFRAGSGISKRSKV